MLKSVRAFFASLGIFAGLFKLVDPPVRRTEVLVDSSGSSSFLVLCLSGVSMVCIFLGDM